MEKAEPVTYLINNNFVTTKAKIQKDCLHCEMLRNVDENTAYMMCTTHCIKTGERLDKETILRFKAVERNT